MEEYSGTTLAARYDYGDDLVRMDRGGVYYYLYDGLGSTRQLVNTVGAATDTYGYSAFGELASRTSTGTTPTVNPFLFNAQQFDQASGDYYLRARYYDQSNGRFISQDPLEGTDEDPVGLHRYLYASGNPVGRVDPGGEQDTLFGLSVSLGVQQTIAAAFVGAAVFAGSTSAQGGSVVQVAQSVAYGAEAGTALAFSSAQGKFLPTFVSALLGGTLGAILKNVVQHDLKETASDLDLTFAFERGFANSAVTSAISGNAYQKFALSSGLTLEDDLQTYVLKDLQHQPEPDFSDLKHQIEYSLTDAALSGILSSLKQLSQDRWFKLTGLDKKAYKIIQGITNEEFAKITRDATQKLSGFEIKRRLKPYAYGLDPSLN